MSIVAGFVCTDGLLICADTETSVSSGKFNASKVHRMEQREVCDYLVAGAGNTGYIGMARDVISEKIYERRAELLASENVQDRDRRLRRYIQNAAIGLYEYMNKACYGEKPFLELLFGIHFKFGEQDAAFDNNEPRLLHIGSDGSVEWVEEAVIGAGDTVARSYLRILHTERIPLELMRPLALFVIYQAKQSGYGCGGSTEMYRLPRTGSVTIWDERGIASLTEQAMRLCLVDARNRELTKEQIEEAANELRNNIIALRNVTEQDHNSHLIAEQLRRMPTNPDGTVGPVCSSLP